MFLTTLTIAAWKAIHMAIMPLFGVFIPTPQDATLQIDSAVNLTASGAGTVFNFNNIGGGVTNVGVSGGVPSAEDENTTGATDSAVPGVGWNPGGLGQPMAIVIQVTALTGTGTYSVVAQEAPDDATWTQNNVPNSVTINAVGTYVLKVFSTEPYARLAWTLGGTSPSITYSAWFNPNIGMR